MRAVEVIAKVVEIGNEKFIKKPKQQQNLAATTVRLSDYCLSKVLEIAYQIARMYTNF